MAYIDKINDLLQETILKNTTSKILQHMGRIRNASSLNQARRWVMELIQNARDVAYNEGIKIRITQTDDKLIFEHNGKPFRVKDVLSIINQASSKDDSIEAVGKFGTGFVTTFQLSESVILKSVLYEEGESPLPFQIKLDRSGKKDEEIEKSILSSMAELRECATRVSSLPFVKGDYNTSFIYDLVGDYEKNIARTGLEDLKNSVNEILLFSAKIQEIKVIIDTAEERKSISYRPLSSGSLDDTNQIEEKVFMWNFGEGIGLKSEKHRLISIKEGTLSLALMVDEKKRILKMEEEKSRIFIDFPLIGSEGFPFPVVINDRRLHPNEPRSGITLVDSERSEEAIENKEIIRQCVSLYGKLFRFLLNENYEDIRNMIEIPLWKENPEMSETWVRNYIYNSLYRTFHTAEIIETDHGRVSLSNSKLRFVDAETEEGKEDVFWLLSHQEKFHTAKWEVDWLGVLEGYLSNEIKLYRIGMKSILENLQRIVKEFSNPEIAFQWVNYLYKTCMKSEFYGNQIKSGSIPIFPSQYPGEFANRRNLYPFTKMRKDMCTDSLLREVAELFFESDKMTDFRLFVVDRRFELLEDGLFEFKDEHLAAYINHFIVYITTNYKMDNMTEGIQIGAAKLAEWIDFMTEKNPEKAKEYFPNFCSDEGRAKLLTSKAVAAISRRLRESQAEIEDLLEKNKSLMKELDQLKDRKGEISNSFFDVVLTQEELDEIGGNPEDIFRKIGNAGEEYAYQRLLRFYLEDGFDEDFDFDLEKKMNLQYEVLRPDTDTYKQAGFDIIVYGRDEEGRLLSEDYFEVKTHTTRSESRRSLKFSEEQMKLALRKGENYHALKVSYHLKNDICTGIEVYSNLIDKIARGELRHLEKGYHYIIG